MEWSKFGSNDLMGLYWLVCEEPDICPETGVFSGETDRYVCLCYVEFSVDDSTDFIVNEVDLGYGEVEPKRGVYGILYYSQVESPGMPEIKENNC